MVNYYGDVEKYEKYLFSEEEGQDRIKVLEECFPKFEEFLGERILDIGCGAGLFTFWLEKKGFEVVGVDKNEKMIEHARETKEKNNFESGFILGNATEIELEGKFDSFVLFGNMIWGIPFKVFSELLNTTGERLKRKGHVIIQYRSLLKMLVNGDWKDIFVDRDSIFSVQKSYEDESGSLEKLYVLPEENTTLINEFYPWSTAILEAIMKAAGFKLIKRFKVEAEVSTTMDIYKKEVKST